MGKKGRPSEGYFNAAGKKVPSVTTILKRFKESGGLIHWAWKLGMERINYRDAQKSACDIGTAVHKLIEWELDGWYIETSAAWLASHLEIKPTADEVKQIQTAYSAFCEWYESSKLEFESFEIPLVSSDYDYGGTCDSVRIKGTKKRAIADWKTSNGLYTDYILQIAAYGLLIEENDPTVEIDSYHVLRFSKDSGAFHHHSWPAEALVPAAEQFLRLREAYDADKEIRKLL